ncbi:LysE family translocator [Burkholderia sp. PU8-34]
MCGKSLRFRALIWPRAHARSWARRPDRALGRCRDACSSAGLTSVAVTSVIGADFQKSFFVAMSNPKYYLLMTALLPQFVDQSLPVAPQYAILAATIAVIDTVVMVGYALLGMHSVRVWKAAGEKWLNRVSGTLLLMLAGYIALYRKGTA